MAAPSNLVLQLLITAKDEASEIVGRIGAGLRGVGDAVSASLEPLRTFGGVMAAAIGIGGTRELLDRADAYLRLTNALKVATDSEEAFQASLKTVTEIAGRTNSDLETTAQLYSRIALNAKAMGLAQSEVADLTTLISQGMQLGGASAAEYGSAVLQLTQAFGSGVLRGEEFNAVMEASPELMRRLATGLGVAIGELRGLAEQGVLTSNIVSKALLSQKDAIATAYAETTQTVEQAFTNLGSKVTLFVGELSESTGASVAATQSLKFLADNLGLVTAALGGALAAALVKSTTAMAGYVQQSLAARAAAADQAIAAAAQQRAAILTAEGHVAAALAAQNQAMAEQRLAQQQLLAIEAIAGLFASEEALTLARAQASAAAQTATTATQRLAAAQSALITVQGGAAASATLFSRAMGFLAGPGGLILAAVSAFALLVPLLSKSKTSTDELASSTDQYRTSLEKLNSTQLTAKTLELNAAIQEQTDAVTKARAAADGLADGSLSLWEVMRDGRPVAVQLAEAQGELADEEQKLAALQANLKTTLDALVGAQQQQIGVGAEQLVQFVQQNLAMQQMASTIDALAKQQKALSTAEQERIENEIALAAAVGDYQRVETLTLQLLGERNKLATQQAATDKAAALAAQARVAALQGEYQGYQQLTPVQEKALRQAQEDAALKKQQAAASQAFVAQLHAQQAGLEASLIAEKQAAAAATQYADTLEGLTKAQNDGLRAEIALASAKGDTAEVQRLTVRLEEQEAEGAARVAQAKWAEQQAEAALAISKLEQLNAIKNKNAETQKQIELAVLVAQRELAEAQAAGVNAETQVVLAQKLRDVNAARQGSRDTQQQGTESVKDNTQATEENSAAQQVNIKHTKESGQGAQMLASYLQQAREAVDDLSASSRLLFEAELGAALYSVGIADSYEAKRDAMIAYKNGVDANREALAEYEKELAQANQLIDQSQEKLLLAANGYRKWEAAIELATGKAKAAFYEQAIEAERATQRIQEALENNTWELQQLADTAQSAMQGFNLLDEQDLSRLQAAIDAANNKLQKMQEETQSAKDRLAELNADILEAQGEDQKAAILKQQLDYQQQLAEVEKQRAEAQLAGNRDLLALLNEQELKLKTLNDLKLKNIQAEAKTEKPSTSSSSASTSSSAATSARSAVSGSYELKLSGAGQALTAYTNTDPSAFLSALEDAQRRGLH